MSVETAEGVETRGIAALYDRADIENYVAPVS